MNKAHVAAGARSWLPEDARLIALVRDRDSDDWAAGVAVGLADMVGRERRPTFLANAAGGSDALDRLMGAEGGPGLTSALTGAATVASIARASAGQRFAYLPAGEAALPYSGLRRMQAFRRFLGRLRDGGGTLLLYLGEEDLGEAAGGLSERDAGRREPELDGCIALGESRGLVAGLGAPLLARVERPAPAPELSAEPHAEPLSEASASAGSRGPGSLIRLLIPLAAVVLVWLGWIGPHLGPEEGAARTGTAVETSGPASRPAGESGAGTTTVPAAERTFQAPEARYSVLVGSYIRLSDAMTRRAELAGDGGLFYVTPTPVRGRIYYRVLAGVYEDRAEAATAMAGLVEDGRKDTNKEWDIRPVRLAFDLGTFATREDADRRVAEALADDVPAYVLRDTASAPLYRVYAGAFTATEDAEPLGRRLAEREDGGELMPRAGVAP